MDFEDRVYHGIPMVKGVDGLEPARILVETVEGGPTQRETRGRVLRDLGAGHEDGDGRYGWGHNGSGPRRAAGAVLADALELPPGDGVFMDAASRDGTLEALREAFCVDVLTQVCPEWRMGRGAVLRWVLGWYVQRGQEPPAVLDTLPPVQGYVS